MDEPVDDRGGRHGVLEDLIPLARHQVGGDDDAFVLLVALGKQGEQDIVLLDGLGDVGNVID